MPGVWKSKRLECKGLIGVLFPTSSAKSKRSVDSPEVCMSLFSGLGDVVALCFLQ